MIYNLDNRFSMADTNEDLVLPGQRLAELGPHRAGPGTYIHRGKIYASIIGLKHIEPASGDVRMNVDSEFLINHPGTLVLRTSRG
jgi:exosome complex RNA-binding protein Csl4